MDGAVSLVSLEEGILSSVDHVNLVLGVSSASHLQALSRSHWQCPNVFFFFLQV